MSAQPVRIALIDDHEVLLESFRLLLDLDPSFEVVGTATTAAEGRDLVLQTRPDIAMFDLDFPGLNSFDVIPQLRDQRCNSRIVLLTAHISDIFVHQAMQLDVAGYLLKNESADFVRDAFRQIAAGRHVFSTPVKSRILFNDNTGKYEVRSSSPIFTLSIMQLSILRHIAAGRTVKEIARLLDRSEKSIDSHKYRIMHRLGVHDRVELCRYAIREGISVL